MFQTLFRRSTENILNTVFGWIAVLLHFCELQWWILHVFNQTLFLLCLKSDFSETKQCSTDLDDNLGGFIYIYLYIMNDSFLLVLIFAWSSLWLTNHPVNLYCVEHIFCSVFSLQPYIQFSEMIMQLKKKSYLYLVNEFLPVFLSRFLRFF